LVFFFGGFNIGKKGAAHCLRQVAGPPWENGRGASWRQASSGPRGAPRFSGATPGGGGRFWQGGQGEPAGISKARGGGGGARKLPILPRKPASGWCRWYDYVGGAVPWGGGATGGFEQPPNPVRGGGGGGGPWGARGGRGSKGKFFVWLFFVPPVFSPRLFWGGGGGRASRCFPTNQGGPRGGFFLAS